MFYNRDSIHSNLDLMYKGSVAYQFARFALNLQYKFIPQKVVHQAKRCLLDALGCAIGAYDAPGRISCENAIKELGGNEESTLFGSGLRTNAFNAALHNSFLVRYLDYNDLGGGGHNSDSIPSIIAVSERENASGKDLITALVISYELGARFKESISKNGDSRVDKAWNSDSRAGIIMPPVIGKLMKLNEEQIANAIGICGTHTFVMGIVDADREELPMSKNFRFGFGACRSILSCLLAKWGVTGFIRIVEGDLGIQKGIFQGDMDLERLVDFSGWRILQVRFKCMPLNGTSLGHVSATLDIVKKHDLKPEDIESVLIRTTHRESVHTTTLEKKYPRNTETAGHSLFYANAIAIKERVFNSESFRPDKFADETVLNLMEKIKVVHDPILPTYGPQAISEIITKDGRFFQKRVDNPHGLGKDPLSDDELANKFNEMAARYMSKEQIKKILDNVWNLENLKDVNKLVKLMVINS